MSTAKKRPTWAYRVTDVTGSMVGRIEVGAVVFDYRHMGRSYTWTIFDLGRGDVTGSFSGDYIGRASYTQRGQLTAETRKRLKIGITAQTVARY